MNDAAAGPEGIDESKTNKVGVAVNESGAELQHIFKDNLVSGRGSDRDKNREAGIAEIDRHQHDFVDQHAKLVAGADDAQANDNIDKVIAKNKDVIK